MAKITKDGMTIEGSVEELREMGIDFNEEETEGFRKVGRSTRVGDYVKAVRTDDYEIEIGRLYEVTGISTLGNPQFTDSVGDQNVLTSEDSYEVYEKVAEQQPKFKVGDYAKVIGGTNRATETGDIVKLIAVAYKEQGGGFVVADINGNELTGAKNSGFLTPATGEEVAVAKQRSDAEKAKSAHAKLFTDAGRKVDEYREGDIVQYEYNRWFENSGIGIVVYDKGSNYVRVIGKESGRKGEVSYNLRKPKVKPIVFVENRVDKSGAK